MTGLFLYYWYGLLASFVIGLVTGWWAWGHRKVALPVEFDPYQEVIEWPAATYSSEPRPRAHIMPRMPIRPPTGPVDAPPLPSSEHAEATPAQGDETDLPDTPETVPEQSEAPIAVEMASDETDVGDEPTGGVEDADSETVAANDDPEPIVANEAPVEEVPIVVEPPEQPVAVVEPADDLLMIKGIGPQLVRLLNGLGVHRFDDIAGWMPEDIEMINSHLGEFRGAMIRDEWIQQARLLARGDMEAFQQRYGHLR